MVNNIEHIRKINGVPVKVKELAGNLYAIILPSVNTHIAQTVNRTLGSVLIEKCGCTGTWILSPSEREQLPGDRTLVCTSAAFTHLLPFYTTVTD